MTQTQLRTKCNKGEIDMSNSTTYEKIQPYLQTILERYQEVHHPSNPDFDGCPYEALQDLINERVLEFSVRCKTWSSPYDALEPDEYRILLAWGGPSVQIEGDLNSGSPDSEFEVVYMDWGTREELRSEQLSPEEREAVEWFLEGFYV